MYPWNESQWSGISKRMLAGRLPHALLLNGPKGLGKSAFAQDLARALLCLQRDDQGHACGQCKSCLLIEAGSHPDIHEVMPEEAGKAIKVDQVRELSDVMSRKSQLSGFRVCIINPAEAMNANAANALLKTLEEPGADSLIMLVSSESSKLTATIRSRCQLINFTPPSSEASEIWLKEQGVKDDLQLLLGLSSYAPLEAMVYVSENRLQLRTEFLNEFLGLKTGVQNPLQMADKWYKKAPGHCVQWMMSWVMDLIRLKSTSTVPRLMNRDVQEHLQPLAKQLNLKNLFVMLDKCQTSNRQLSTQVNVQLMMEDLFITWIKTR